MSFATPILTFHEHPGEGSEEEEVEETSHHAAHHWLVCLVDSRQEHRLRDQQTHAQVLMDGGAITLGGRRSRHNAARDMIANKYTTTLSEERMGISICGEASFDLRVVVLRATREVRGV